MNWIDKPIVQTKRPRELSPDTVPGKRQRYKTDAERHEARRKRRRESERRSREQDRGFVHKEDPAMRVVAPREVWAAADRFNQLTHQSITGWMMGDPLPGRSALDTGR